jgi:hypothetical protein
MSWVGVAVAGIGAVGGLLGSEKAAGAQTAASREAIQSQERMFEQMRKDLGPYRQIGTQATMSLADLLGLNMRAMPTAPTQAQFMRQTQAAAPGRFGGQVRFGGQGAGMPIAFDRNTAIMSIPSMGGATSRFDKAAYDAAMRQYQQDLAGYNAYQPSGSLLKPFTLADFEESPGYQFNLQQGEQAIRKAAAARGNYYAPQTLQDISRFSQGLASNEFQQALQNYRAQQGDVYSRLFGVTGLGQSAAAQTGAAGIQTGQGIAEAQLQGGAARAGGIIGGTNALLGGLGDIGQQIQLRNILTQSGYTPASGARANWYGPLSPYG